MKRRFASKFRTVLPIAIALSLITAIFSFAPSALAASPPTISLVSPSSGTTAGGTTLTITGTDYLIPGFKVSFDGVDNFSYTNRTNTSFNLVTPAHAAGTVVILVHTDLIPDATANYTYVTPFHVTYLNSGSTSGIPPSDSNPYMSGDLVTVLGGGTLVRTGYAFGGWQDCVIVHIYGSAFTITGNTDLCPLWTANLAHTVTFKSNFSGGPADTIQTASTTTNLTANSFTRPGYTFNSWNTDPAGGGMGLHFLEAASYNFAADMIVYAQWTSNASFTVTYLGNDNSGGTVPIDSTAYASGNTVTVLGQNTLVKTGYTFGGWNSGGGIGPSITYQLGQTFTISSNTTLTAIWTANGSSFTITYLGNGNTGGVAPSPTTGSGAVMLATNTGNFVKTGSTFSGWNTAANGSGTPYAVASSYNLVADITLYAGWTPIVSSTTFTVTYVGNGATGGNTPVDSALYSSGALVTVRPLGTLVRNGYTFIGWDNGGSITYQPNQTFNISGNVTLTALWNAGKYTVIYDGNGNSGGDVPVDTKVYSPGSLVTVLSNGSLVKSGFTFSGWTKAGSVTVYAPTRVFIILGDTTLTAVWSTSPTYTITYSGNGNTGGSVPISVTGSGSVPLATNTGGLVKTGYTFVGWNTYANGLGTLRPVGSSYLLSGNVTMYADFVSATVSKNVPSLILKGKIVITAPPKKIALNQIVPVHQQFLTKLPTNAIGFELYENGKFAISAKSNSVFLKQIVGPKDQVTVVAVGKDGTKSAPSPVSLSKDPISLANINFNTDSYQFIGIATKILDKVATVMIQHGYTHLDIWGYVDTQGSKASWITLSNNRAKAVNNYMAHKLQGTGITIKNAGRAQTQAVGNNNTAAGRALNRRVEIRVS
jgi:uncharacterized repeat protein (TIGR02543 family)